LKSRQVAKLTNPRGKEQRARISHPDKKKVVRVGKGENGPAIVSDDKKKGERNLDSWRGKHPPEKGQKKRGRTTLPERKRTQVLKNLLVEKKKKGLLGEGDEKQKRYLKKAKSHASLGKRKTGEIAFGGQKINGIEKKWGGGGGWGGEGEGGCGGGGGVGDRRGEVSGNGEGFRESFTRSRRKGCQL